MPTKRQRCTKVPYPSKRAALAALMVLPLNRPEVRVYRCGKHTRSTWHLTSRAR